MDLAEASVIAHIIPDDVQDVPVIVGQPFADQPNVVVVQRIGELRLFEKRTAELPEVDQLPPRKVELWAEKACVIPPGEIADIKVIVKDFDYKGDIFIDLSLRGKENQEHCIPRCIINISVGVLPVVNLSDYPLCIDGSRILARGEITRQVTEKEVCLLTLEKERSNKRHKKLPITSKDVVVDDDVSSKELDKLVNILNEYRDCFAFCMSELGKTDLAEMKIELTTNTLVYYRPYRLSFSERDKVKGIIKELKRMN